MADDVIIKLDINKMLYAMLGKADLVDMWWTSPNKGFEGNTPNSIYRTGLEGRRRVYDYVRGYLQK